MSPGALVFILVLLFDRVDWKSFSFDILFAEHSGGVEVHRTEARVLLMGVITPAGVPATLEIRKILENEFPIFKSGKTPNNRGKLREFDSDIEGKGFSQFGVCASCAMCPS